MLSIEFQFNMADGKPISLQCQSWLRSNDSEDLIANTAQELFIYFG